VKSTANQLICPSQIMDFGSFPTHNVAVRGDECWEQKMATEIPISDKVLLSRDDLTRLGIGKSNTTLLRWEKLGRFPPRMQLAGTSVCWLASEIKSWIEDRAADRSKHVYADI
jgi:predicted DNA-binding transcriptional regulator AlpA